MNTFLLLNNLDVTKSISFLKKDIALSYQKFDKDNDYTLFEIDHKTHINAQNYIDWKDIPSKYNFVFRDSNGVCASIYKPKGKWYTKDNIFKYVMYGGEKESFEYENYHELINYGDIFERQTSTKHFINWKIVKKSYAIKYFDNKKQTIEIFDRQGNLIYSGSNDDIKMINKNLSFQFELFPFQVYTFIRE